MSSPNGCIHQLIRRRGTSHGAVALNPVHSAGLDGLYRQALDDWHKEGGHVLHPSPRAACDQNLLPVLPAHASRWVSTRHVPWSTPDNSEKRHLALRTWRTRVSMSLQPPRTEEQARKSCRCQMPTRPSVSRAPRRLTKRRVLVRNTVRHTSKNSEIASAPHSLRRY